MCASLRSGGQSELAAPGSVRLSPRGRGRRAAAGLPRRSHLAKPGEGVSPRTMSLAVKPPRSEASLWPFPPKRSKSFASGERERSSASRLDNGYNVPCFALKLARMGALLVGAPSDRAMDILADQRIGTPVPALRPRYRAGPRASAQTGADRFACGKPRLAASISDSIFKQPKLTNKKVVSLVVSSKHHFAPRDAMRPSR